jgi:hypothetical protein
MILVVYPVEDSCTILSDGRRVARKAEGGRGRGLQAVRADPGFTAV